jgi:hypothetical protein
MGAPRQADQATKVTGAPSSAGHATQAPGAPWPGQATPPSSTPRHAEHATHATGTPRPDGQPTPPSGTPRPGRHAAPASTTPPPGGHPSPAAGTGGPSTPAAGMPRQAHGQATPATGTPLPGAGAKQATGSRRFAVVGTVFGALGIPFLGIALLADHEADNAALATFLVLATVLGLSLAVVSGTRHERGARGAIIVAAVGLLGALLYGLSAWAGV